MYNYTDAWMMKKVFHLSDHAIVRMVNGLFHTEYEEGEPVRREWKEQEVISICLTIGCANRYAFSLRRFGSCLQISMEDKGCSFYYEDAREHSPVQLMEPHMTYFGDNTKKEFCTMLEFSEHERIILPVYSVTLNDRSARRLEEAGLILFLPFLFYCFAAEEKTMEEGRESLKSFVINDIVGALQTSMRKGDLTVPDMENLKQCCRSMIWRVLWQERWMQNRELQELILQVLDADLEQLERWFRKSPSVSGDRHRKG